VTNQNTALSSINLLIFD